MAKTISIDNRSYNKLEILSKNGHRPKSMQIALLIDFYVEQHPGALHVEEPLYAEE